MRPGSSAGSFGIAAPKGTPAEIIESLNRETNAGLADPAIKARLAELAIAPYQSTAAEFAGLIASETKKWGKVIRDSGIKAE